VQVWQNITTNEVMNWHRYKHFRVPGETGEALVYHNPFDKGPIGNCRETCFPSQALMAPTFLETKDMANLRVKLHELAA
jgi:hypothetical protein